MKKRICEVCNDVQLIEWQQLTLDDTHIMEYRASLCLCGWTILTILVKETVVDEA